MQICNNRNMEKVVITHRTMDRERNSNLKKSIPSHGKRRVTGR
jgi:hypothetical protein